MSEYDARIKAEIGDAAASEAATATGKINAAAACPPVTGISLRRASLMPRRGRTDVSRAAR